MVISNTKNSIYVLLLMFLLVSCNEKKNECLALYHFTEEIIFKGYTPKEIESSKVFFQKTGNPLKGMILFNKNEKFSAYGRIRFESISDTICKNDTLYVLIAGKKHFLTEIILRHVNVSLGSDRPGFIEYKIDGVQFKEGGVISKEKHIN